MTGEVLQHLNTELKNRFTAKIWFTLYYDNISKDTCLYSFFYSSAMYFSIDLCKHDIFIFVVNRRAGEHRAAERGAPRHDVGCRVDARARAW